MRAYPAIIQYIQCILVCWFLSWYLDESIQSHAIGWCFRPISKAIVIIPPRMELYKIGAKPWKKTLHPKKFFVTFLLSSVTFQWTNPPMLIRSWCCLDPLPSLEKKLYSWIWLNAKLIYSKTCQKIQFYTLPKFHDARTGHPHFSSVNHRFNP